jgi:hypothetical protein
MSSRPQPSLLLSARRGGIIKREHAYTCTFLVIAPAKIAHGKVAPVQYGAAGSGSSSCQLGVANEALLKIKMAGNAPF